MVFLTNNYTLHEMVSNDQKPSSLMTSDLQFIIKYLAFKLWGYFPYHDTYPSSFVLVTFNCRYILT